MASIYTCLSLFTNIQYADHATDHQYDTLVSTIQRFQTEKCLQRLPKLSLTKDQ